MRKWEKELRILLDEFPDDALALYSALEGDAFDGESTDVGDCACAISTVGAAAGINYDRVALRLKRKGLAKSTLTMCVLPALEEYVVAIQPALWEERWDDFKQQFTMQQYAPASGRHRARAVQRAIIRWAEDRRVTA